MLGYGAVVVRQQAIGFERARAQYQVQAVAIDAKRDAIAAPIAAKQEAAQARVRTVTQAIIKEVPIYVKAADCPMPGGFRVLHDAAAHGEIPDAAGIADAAAVPAQDVAATVADNYGACHATAARLTGLQDWVSQQQALKIPLKEAP